MEFFNLLWNIFAFVIMTTFEIVANAANEVMFTLENKDVYGKIAKVRKLLLLAGAYDFRLLSLLASACRQVSSSSHHCN